jgi:hypothetical protein
MILLYLVNVSGNNTIDIEWNRTDSTHVHLLGAKNMTAGEFIQWSGSYIVLEPGETMTIVATGSPHVDLICTVEEYFLPNRPAKA